MHFLDHFIVGTGLPDIFGNPYHGVVWSTGLDTGVPDPGVITGLYAGPDSYTLYVPGTPPVVRTPEQAADDALYGCEWRDRALIGRDHTVNDSGVTYIYGERFAWAQPSWLYADPNGNRWLVRLLSSNQQAPTTFSGHLTTRLQVLRFGVFQEYSADLDNIIELAPAPAVLTFPTDGQGVVMYPSSYNAACEAYGDFNLINAASYSLVVLDVKASGSKVLLGCIVRITAGSVFEWIRSIVEVTVSGAGSTDPLTMGQGITVSLALVRNASQCDTHTRNWEIDYIDNFGNPQHFSGDVPPISPNWQSITTIESDFQSSRLVAAWYDNAGAIKYRWLEYARFGVQEYTIDNTPPYECHAVLTNTETFSYSESGVVKSTMSFLTTHNASGDSVNNPTYVYGDETLKLLDYYVVGDPVAREWSHDKNDNPRWTKVHDDYSKWSEWKTTFNDGDGFFIRLPVYNWVFSYNLLLPYIGWGPMSLVYLHGCTSMLQGDANNLSSAQGLWVVSNVYNNSALIHGWGVCRSKYTYHSVGLPGYTTEATGWLVRDVCTPCGHEVDASRKTTTEQSPGWSLTTTVQQPYITRFPSYGAAYDRYSNVFAWGSPSTGYVIGYV